MTKLRAADSERRAEAEYSSDFSEALARGMTILGAFTAERRQMTLSDVARVVDLPRATARRALYTLAYLGFVETEDRLYKLTPKVMTIASAYLTSNPVTTVIQPLCERISSKLELTCSAGVLEGDEVVLIARASPAQPSTIGLGVGYRLPAFCSALGRVLLSGLSNDQLKAHFKNVKRVKVTQHTTTSVPQLTTLVNEVRKSGCAYVNQETDVGFHAVAVPLYRYDGKQIGALNIGTQVERISEEALLKDCLPFLVEQVEEVKGQLI